MKIEPMGEGYKLALQERADLRQRLHALSNTSELTAEEQAEWDKGCNRLTDLNAAIDEAEIEREKIRGGPMPMLGWDLPKRTEERPGVRGRRYADMFGKPAAMEWPGGAEEFFRTIHTGVSHDLLKPMAIAGTGVPADGGFFIPEELVAEMLDASLEDEIVRPRADVTPMLSETKSFATFDVSDSSSVLYGAFSGQWVGEGDEITAETPKARLARLTANKLAVLTEVANELLQSGVGYSEQLLAAMTKAIAWFMDEAFLTGNGAGKPQGVLNDPAIITVNKETGQPSGTIIWENVANMEARLHPASERNAIWVANHGARAQLLQMARAVGTGGDAVPVLTGRPGNYELNLRPVIFTEKLPAVGTLGDIILADFSQYKIGLRKEMSLDRSGHVGFTRDTTHFRGILRGDGMGKWKSAYTPKNGDSTSWAVQLEAR